MELLFLVLALVPLLLLGAYAVVFLVMWSEIRRTERRPVPADEAAVLDEPAARLHKPCRRRLVATPAIS